MKAHFCTYSITDLVRPNHKPLINYTENGFFSDRKDFVFNAQIRYLGIKKEYPNAEFLDLGDMLIVLVDGVMVYETHIIHINPEAVEMDDDADEWNEK